MKRPSPLDRALLLSTALTVCLPLGCGAGVEKEAYGTYRFKDGRLMSVRRSEGKTLRYRMFGSGESRRLYPRGKLRYETGPGFAARTPVDTNVEFQRNAEGDVAGLLWKPVSGASRSAGRIDRQRSVRFANEDAVFSARLSLPRGPGPHPAVVLVHGSGSQAATEYYFNGDFLAAHGIATLTYDKRGTGGSTGRQTFDFRLLARDVVAAVEHLAAQPEIDPRRIGLSAYSQGAWVAPLAASMSDSVRWVIVHYGLIGSPAEEARVETRALVRRRGVDEDSLDQLDELTLAAVEVVANDFRDGWDELDAVEKRYRRQPWRKKLSGTVVGKMIRYPRWVVRALGSRYSLSDLDWHYDSEQLLGRLDVPMVWLLAEADSSAPPELTLPALERLRASGRPYETMIFPGADHSMLLFEEKDGERVYTRYAPGYFRAEVEAARRLTGLGEGG